MEATARVGWSGRAVGAGAPQNLAIAEVGHADRARRGLADARQAGGGVGRGGAGKLLEQLLDQVVPLDAAGIADAVHLHNPLQLAHAEQGERVRIVVRPREADAGQSVPGLLGEAARGTRGGVADLGEAADGNLQHCLEVTKQVLAPRELRSERARSVHARSRRTAPPHARAHPAPHPSPPARFAPHPWASTTGRAAPALGRSSHPVSVHGAHASAREAASAQSSGCVGSGAASSVERGHAPGPA